jgi:hypothetical protein
MARKPTDPVQLKLRFYEKLRRQLERAAANNGRSINAEIVHRLAESFDLEHALHGRISELERIFAAALEQQERFERNATALVQNVTAIGQNVTAFGQRLLGLLDEPERTRLSASLADIRDQLSRPAPKQKDEK